MFTIDHDLYRTNSEDTISIVIAKGDYDEDGFHGHSVLEGEFTGSPEDTQELLRILKGVLLGEW